MKKSLTIFIAILIALYAFLSLLDTKSDYVIEQRLWRVDKKLTEVAKDTNVVPDQTYHDLVFQYQKIIDRFPNSRLTARARMSLAHVYFIKKDYPKTREKLTEVILDHSADKELCARAIFMTGKVFEIEGDWPHALEAYKRIMAEYPFTSVGYSAPLYIATYYENKNIPRQTDQALDEAVLHYKRISMEHPNSLIEFNALRLLATTYFKQKEWSKGMATLEKVLLEYPDRQYLTIQRAGLIVKTINTVSLTQLQDYNIPIQIYERFIAQNTSHPLNSVLTEMIKGIKKLQEKNIRLQRPEEPG